MLWTARHDENNILNKETQLKDLISCLFHASSISSQIRYLRVFHFGLLNCFKGLLMQMVGNKVARVTQGAALKLF